MKVHKIATLLKTDYGNISAAIEYLMKTSHLINTQLKNIVLRKKILVTQFSLNSSSVCNSLFYCLVPIIRNSLKNTINYFFNIQLNTVLQCKPAPPTWSLFITFSKYHIASFLPIILRGKYTFQDFFYTVKSRYCCQLHHAC